jgi:hypothetical protein
MDSREMPRLDRRAGNARRVGYADPRASDLVIHRMPGNHIRWLQQVADGPLAARVGLDMTPVRFVALAAVTQRPRIDQARLSAPIGYDRATIGGAIDRLEARARGSYRAGALRTALPQDPRA